MVLLVCGQKLEYPEKSITHISSHEHDTVLGFFIHLFENLIPHQSQLVYNM